MADAIQNNEFTEPDFQLRDDSDKIIHDDFIWEVFRSVVQTKFRFKFPSSAPLVFTKDFQVQDETGVQEKRVAP